MADFSWAKLSDDELLDVRICELGLQLEQADYYPQIGRILDELHQRDIDIHPRVYVGDEWFSPDGEAAVAIPFFLLHPRLRQLEKEMMYECEGESPSEFKKLFRHELGHVFDHAFHVSRRKTWQKTFGNSKKPYNTISYRPRPYSKNFVRNISDEYAQAHPDEDFAETFAVWLDPNSQWVEKYKGWGALKKLQYVDRVCKEFAGVPVSPPTGRMISDARYLRSTLRNYYKKKKKLFEDYSPDFFDRDLSKIFGSLVEKPFSESAASYLKSERNQFVDSLSRWTNERKVVINELYDDFIQRAKDLQLVLKKDRVTTQLELTAMMATVLTNYRLTGRFKKK